MGPPGKVCASLPSYAMAVEQQCCHLMTINNFRTRAGLPETSHDPVTHPRLPWPGPPRQVGK